MQTTSELRLSLSMATDETGGDVKRGPGAAPHFHSLNRSIADSLNTEVEQEIDSFIRFLATERGLSDNYQLSTRRSLTEFAAWCSSARQITLAREVTQPLISEYLSTRKEGGLSASSIKLVVVALKIFFDFSAG